MPQVTRNNILNITVHGLPKPQGSKKAFMPKGARFPSVVESAGEKLKEWRHAVALVAAREMGDKTPSTGPVAVGLAFFLPRSKSHYRTGKFANELKASAPVDHIKKPDADKLTRAVLDSLSNRAYRDDSQVVRLSVTKEYTERSPCCVIIVDEA